MEFTDIAKTNAEKFLRQFVTTPPEGKGAPPLVPHTNLASFTEGELEGECLDMARTYLAKKGCPGILSYHISRAAYQRLRSSGPLDEYHVPVEGGVNGDTPTPAQLDASLVSKGLLSSIEKVCEEWAKSLPVLTAPEAKCDLSLFAAKNTRRKMEDRHALCVDVNSLFGLKDCPPQSYYGVFDGHVGVEAAAYAAVHLLPNLVRHPLFCTDPEAAMKGAFKTTDEHFCEKTLRAGSTAVAALFRGQKLYMGWLGDSQAVLVRRNKPIFLVEPHKPDREDERERIEAAGGLVVWLGVWRVNGNLSVSRAIGDAGDKKYVIGEADVKSIELDGTEDYLVLACDGVWDVVNGEELVECVQQYLGRGGTHQGVAKAIVEFAQSEGSGDNMTCIVVFFPSFQVASSLPQNDVQEKACNPAGATDNS